MLVYRICVCIYIYVYKDVNTHRYKCCFFQPSMIDFQTLSYFTSLEKQQKYSFGNYTLECFRSPGLSLLIEFFPAGSQQLSLVHSFSHYFPFRNNQPIHFRLMITSPPFPFSVKKISITTKPCLLAKASIYFIQTFINSLFWGLIQQALSSLSSRCRFYLKTLAPFQFRHRCPKMDFWTQNQSSRFLEAESPTWITFDVLRKKSTNTWRNVNI